MEKKQSARRCSVKTVFLDILQNSQENTCARVSFLIKLQTEAWNFTKKETLAQGFSVNFAKFLRIPFSRNPPDNCSCVFKRDYGTSAKEILQIVVLHFLHHYQTKLNVNK